MNLSVVILAAGKSRRMHSKLSKVLHPLAGKPMVEYAVDTARAFSSTPPVLVVGENEDQVRAVLGDRVQYVRQREPLGTGHAVLQAREALEDRGGVVLVCFADMPLLRRETLEGIVDLYRRTEPTIAMLSVVSEDSMAYGRVVRDGFGQVSAIVEEAVATPEQLAIRELNCSVYCFQADWLWVSLGRIEPSPKGEYYLTDTVGLAISQGLRVEALISPHVEEVVGPNTRVQLAQAERVMRRRINEELMLSGVTMLDPESTYVHSGVEVGEDTVILPGTCLWGETWIGPDCRIGPNTVLQDCTVGARCTVTASHLEDAAIGDDCSIGPFARVRGGAVLEPGVHMGSFGEVKNSRLGPNVKMGHFSYIGDASVGAGANIGAGAVTCNFDGRRKHHTDVGEGAFVGSGTMLVAPIQVGAGAVIGAGAVVTHDVAAGETVYGVPARPRSR